MRRKKIGIKDFGGSVDITDPCYDRKIILPATLGRMKQNELPAL